MMQIPVKEIMTPNVISVPETMPVKDVATLLSEKRITGVPVVDDEGRVTGVLSEYDIISRQGATAADIMSRQVISAAEETDAGEVAQLLTNRRIRRVPILAEGRLVGIVSRADLVREIALSWVCQVCGDHERGRNPPDQCPKCGTPSGFEPTASPPVGEGAEISSRSCPTCGQALPD